MPKLINLVGQRFGRLTVVQQAVSVAGNARWTCDCDCGNRTVVWGQDLRSGKSTSCGCRRAEVSGDIRRKHGMSLHPAYGSWRAAKRRCEDPADMSYALYGGRGIKFCDLWRDFDNFWRDMGPTWRPRLSLDRIDTDGNYEPANCRWATAREQGNNRRNNHLIDTPRGMMTIADAAEKYGLSHKTITARIRYGWTGHDLVRPVMDKTEYLKQYRKDPHA